MSAVAAVMLTAAVALASGCGAGGGDDNGPGGGGRGGAGKDGHSAPPGATAPASPGKDGSGERAADGGGERAVGDKGTPKLPRARLTPATGSFTEKEKDYLTRRVPRGMDPAAVLEAGENACARIRTTAKASEKDAISALKAGEIDSAGPAVKHLCPKFAPLLKAAGKD
ncbi:hypothetical protein [Streptomyces axinellae]|uniref:hypothetical protein n=1 Tax=Streptomyces axinellae TaxID=552788 RepID=UPI0031D4B706